MARFLFPELVLSLANMRALYPFLVLAFATLLAAQDRMPPIPAEKMTEAQKKSVAAVAATPRGNNGNAGPFVPLTRSPELMDRLQAVGAQLRFHNSIPQKLVEMTILMVARKWTQQYEWQAHYPLALKEGLKVEAARAIAEGRRPAGLSEDEEMVWDFNHELLHNQNVSDATYARVEKRFGQQGVVDLTGIDGYYTTLAMMMTVARTAYPQNTNVPPLDRYEH